MVDFCVVDEGYAKTEEEGAKEMSKVNEEPRSRLQGIGKMKKATVAVGIIAVLVASVLLVGVASAAWCNSDRDYRKQVDIGHINASGSALPNNTFFVNVSVEAAMQADGDDLLFYNSTCAEVDYELEYIGGGYAQCRVRIPSHATSGTTLYMYYGNAGVGAGEDMENTWEPAAKMVQHLQEAAVNDSAGDHVDSTANNNDGMAKNFDGTATSTTDGTGKIDGADVFDGTDDYINCGNDPLLGVPDEFTASEAGSSQQGIATDGIYIYVTNTTQLFKYDLNGNYIGASSVESEHFVGIAYYDGHIYVSVSECLSGGTANHWIYKYNTSLEKVAEYDIGSHFTICVGAIGYYNDYFYVAESYFDNDHDDKIVKFDTSFNYVETITTNHKCGWGVQGIEYVPSEGLFQINCHATEFYRINTAFDNSSIRTYVASFSLQDLSYLNSSTSMYNDRDTQKIKFANNALNIFHSITIEAWMKREGSGGAYEHLVSKFRPTKTWLLGLYVGFEFIIMNESGVRKDLRPGGISVVDGVWYYYVGVYDGSIMRGYINGVDIGSTIAQSGNIKLTTTDISIGGTSSANDFFNGTIDEIRIYNRALSADEITQSYEMIANQSSWATWGSAEEYCVAPPTITANSTGNFWANYTFAAGSSSCGLSASSYNILWSNNTASGWQNGTTDLFFKHTTQAHGYVDVDVWAYNSTEGKLSVTAASDNVTVPNNAPSTPSLVSPSNLSEINDATSLFNWTCTDADGDSITYTIQIDNETGFSSPYIYENSSITQSNHTLAEADNLTDGKYCWRIRANDTYTDSNWATFYNFTLDTVLPSIIKMARSPDSVLVGDPVTITCTVTDDVSGVENVTVQIKDAKDRINNYTLTAGANDTYSYIFNYTGKSGWYYIQYFRSYDEAGNLRENSSDLSFSATPYSGGPGGPGVVPSPTPDVNVTVTPLPTPPLEWIRHPEMPVSGRDAITIIIGVVGTAFVLLVLAIMWDYNKGLKREGGGER